MKKHILFIAVLCITFTLITRVKAQDKNLYTLDKTIALPGDGGYDYLYIDQQNNKLYVSHGNSVNIIDLKTESFIGTIDSLQGVHGITIVNSIGKGFITDGKTNSVIVFDIKSNKRLTTIPLSGKKPDAIIYDIYSNKVFAFNGGSSNISVIDVDILKEISTITLDGAPEFATADGHGLIFNNIENKNSIKLIDSKNLRIIKTFQLSNCKEPSGLAIDTTNKRLFTVGGESKTMSVIDYNGNEIATLPIGGGVDAVTYDPVTKLVYCSCGEGVTTIIKQESADKYAVVQTLITQKRARTMALDTYTHKIYLSVADFVVGTRTPIKGSFKVLVYKLN